MGNEVAPEFVFDQGLYYPAAANYYGYYYTGTEVPTEWDDQHSSSGLDGQDLQYPALQAESLPYVYCPPNYEYAQSPYNPYNPYIPGAVMGTDGPYIGTQQYFNESSFQQSVSLPNYIPVVVPSSSDMAPYTPMDHFFVNTAGGKYVPPLSSVSVTPSLKGSLQNPALEPFRPFHQMLNAVRPLDGSVNTTPSRHGGFTSGIAPYMTQGTEGGLQSIHAPVKVATPANNGFTYLEPNARRWTVGDRSRPRPQLNGISSRNLADQNIGPRINRPRGQLTSPITSRTYPTREASGNSDGSSIVHVDQYNRDDFPLDYANAKFFVIKSYSEDDVHKSIKYNVWSSTSSGNKRLDIAYEEAQNEKPRKCPLFLFFSVNASGHFCGVAEMIGPVDVHKDMDFWLQDKWTGSFPVKWLIVKDVPNSSFRHIILANNEHRPVTSSRDTQEVPYLPGMSMLTIFKNSPMKTSILDDYMYYEERQRIMLEERSRFYPRRTYQTTTSVYLPTSIKLNGAINQPLRMDVVRFDDTVVQAPVSELKEPNVVQASVSECKEPNVKESTPESNGKAYHHTVGQNLKAEDKQLSVSSCKPLINGDQHDGIIRQPLRTNDNIPNNAKPPSSDGIQLNHGVNQFRAKSGKQIKRPVNCDSPGKLDSSQDEQNAKPGSVGDTRDASSAALSSKSKTDEDDVAEVLTVGSMLIKVNKTNSLFSGTLTLGSIPADMKALNLK
ncbi:uncharacterized protein M6B38_273680 [Iris pallida]|uniref:YTH domain-containing family protein n=1 Tax=Iris pallida TaxID=29817 RepID=A0AAX6I5P6_IRIPA|nr:uncharacterized protein M6B38_415090 [Iris pallida]KAJ6848311.1 uncharacterized protein M6B38_273680 [Iris pallida]